MKKIKSFNKDNYNIKEPIIIYGASVYGEIAYFALKALGVIPDYFCDRAAKDKEYFGVKVIKPSMLADKVHANIIIASVDYFYDILEYLQDIGCDNIYDMSELMQLDFDLGILSERAKYKLDYKKQYIDLAHSVTLPNKLSFSRVQYIVTEKCSLKCRDCSHLMQYYKYPQNIDLDKYKSAFECFLEHVGMISDLRILGGEPLMNPAMYKVIDWFHSDKCIKTISVYTNGTIVPNKEIIEYFKYDNVRVHVSQYEVNKERIKKVISCLENNKIKYYVEPFTNWQTPGNLIKRNCSEAQNIEKFQRCFDSNGYYFYKDRLYRCPRSVHGVNIGAIPDNDSEYVDFGKEGISYMEIEERLKRLMARTSLEACDYCDGLDNHRQSIEPGIQIKYVKSFSE